MTAFESATKVGASAPTVAGNHVRDAAHAFYNDKVVHQFMVATMFWGIAGMLVGVLIAAQLYWPALNFDTAWLSYGRLRPLHTNGVSFGFGGRSEEHTSELQSRENLVCRL